MKLTLARLPGGHAQMKNSLLLNILPMVLAVTAARIAGKSWYAVIPLVCGMVLGWILGFSLGGALRR